MTPLSLTITNFGPFKGTQIFDFPRAPGLYFMWGDNKEEPRLQANGAGKSKFWEALVWCIFGKTSRGLKAGDAANWEAGKGTEVRLGYTLTDGLPEFIIRTWGPNSWTHRDLFGNVTDLAKDSNKFMADLRLEFLPFLNSVMMAQGEPLFLDLKAEAKASLFASVMSLDRWIEYAAKSSKQASEQDVICRRLERELSAIRGQAAELSGGSLEPLAVGWDRDQAEKIKRLEDEYGALLDREQKAKIAAHDAGLAEAGARQALKQANSDVADAEAQVTEQEARVRGAEKRVDAATTHLDQLEKHTRLVKDHDQCPTCQQEITPAFRRTHLAEASRGLETGLGALEDAERALAKAQADLEQGQEARNGARKRFSRLTLGVDEAASLSRAQRADYERLGRRLDELEAQADALTQEKNPYSALLDDQDQRRSVLKAEEVAVQARLDDHDSQFRIFTGWVKWFKEIRLSLIAEALEQLEVEVNSCVNALGLIGWELRFEVDRESKTGSIQRGFNVFVQSPHNAKLVPWEAWSGGESQRLRVAAQQGLGNLIRQRTGSPFNIEVWDEPTNWMSPQGVTDLLDSLAERAAREGRQIWIVDHRTLGYSNFAGSAGVIKTKAGSHFDLSGLYKSTHDQHPQRVQGQVLHDRRTRTRVA